MAILDITQADSSDMTNAVDDVTVDGQETDGVLDQNETEYTFDEWSQWWGYFNEIADLNSALLMKSIWNVGKGYTADESTNTTLENIQGWGKDTFEDILFNMDVIRHVNGDSFAEIIRNDDGALINLKPLDPGTIKIVVGRDGIIKRYEQMSKVKTSKTVKKFIPANMFHLTANRMADQIHGISSIKAMEETIKADNENFTDLKTLMHHQAKPFIMWKLKTDDQVKIKKIIDKIDSTRNLSEDLFVPDDEDIISWEVVQVSISDSVFNWRNDIRNKFYRTLGLPLIIFGSAGSTESGGKIEYLAHEQVFARDQKYLEKQIWNQLAIKLKLVPPTTLLENLQNDEKKDANQGLEVQPQDVSAGNPNGS